MDKSKINKYIKEHQNLTREELARKCGISENAVRKREGAMKLKRVQETTLKEVIASKREAGEQKEVTRNLNEAIKEIERLEKEKEALFKVKKTAQTFNYKYNGNGKSEAVAFMVASDWHVEEPVEKEQVNDMNEYNLELAKSRAEKFFTNGLRLVQIQQNFTTINTIVVPLLGDFISNSIHEELMESNLLLPGDALWFAKSLIASGIDYLLANSECNIVVVCHTGNHGRMTRKVHVSTEGGNSLEKYMYRDLAERYEGNKRVKFIISESMMTYCTFFGYTVRFLHGHSVKYGGGVGGITIPIRKAIAQWNKVRNANLTVLGHFHQMFDGGDFLVNGSLIGYNAFAQFIKADYEPPKQAFFLVSNYLNGTKESVTPIRLL